MRTEVSSLLDKFDKNGDGKLNYAQVYKFIKKIVKDRMNKIEIEELTESILNGNT